MAYSVNDIVTPPNATARYRVVRIRCGHALLLPLSRGTARIVHLSRLAQAAAAPTT